MRGRRWAAASFFEYWLTGDSTQTRRTDTRYWPAGASGRFSEVVRNLAGALSYSFRLCGADEGQAQPACAQTRSFTTRTPTEDSVRGSASFGCCSGMDVDAASGPSGERPRGSLSMRLGSSFSQTSYRFTGFVTCLVVDGNRAAIGAVGHERVLPQDETRPATALASVVDGRIGDDLVSRYETSPGSSPPDCAAAPEAPNSGFLVEFIVDDAPAG